MSDPIICNVCRKEIKDPAEQVDRRYRVKAAGGRELPPQKKHDACDLEYAKKAGLEKVQS